ncbi:hypothetical protein BC937DRAFT_91636 [Endogone sp. FLAS-F59071]|nr:hypothetical protein BC937DRAFT_91636 [Endogone sp. FLAS-F59071]|eukprot:RUS16075.1 hypothetical protein BC937DRAFT_91636 [Endogone sp. FLAS-F59071]
MKPTILPAFPLPFSERLDVVKQLRDDKIGASIHLLLKVSLVILNIFCISMALWVSCNADTKVVAVEATDMADQINGVGEAIIARRPVFLAARRVWTGCGMRRV